jgi:hypothetical protein
MAVQARVRRARLCTRKIMGRFETEVFVNSHARYLGHF